MQERIEKMSIWFQADNSESEVIRDTGFQNCLTTWAARPANAPSRMFHTTPRTIAHMLAIEATPTGTGASAYTVRFCDHDGKPHINVDMRVYHQTRNGEFIGRKEYGWHHREKYGGTTAWEDLRLIYGVPAASQVALEEARKTLG